VRRVSKRDSECSRQRYASDDAQLGALKRYVTEGLADGSLSPGIARTFPFDEIVEAHRFMEEGNQVGKILVTV
jgi:NADPH:quinone reductase-like Zn-dependent oxidoreductase